ncbi:MAG: hypothetical protein ACK452_05395 [Bacteroidota bacterium]|jgi:hypothetical protein
MKFIFTLLSALLFQSAFAQFAPFGFNYQAVVRDANGNAKTNQQVPLQFTILQSGTNGTVVWQERQVLNTNGMGQCNAVIGSGVPVIPFTSSSFSQINWGLDSTFLKVETNANTSFTGVFSLLGPVTKLQSVPYALFAVTKSPTIQTFTNGSGTYNTPTGVKYIKVRMVGGGGGGAGSGTSSGIPTNGGNTTFGTSLLTALGGNPGQGSNGGSGGNFSVASPAINISSVKGGQGYGPGQLFQAAYYYNAGGAGGDAAFFGGGGKASGFSANGSQANANTGGGGQGGGLPGSIAGTQSTGGGGGAGGFVEAMILNPSGSYLYSVGTGGTGGIGNQFSGGAGASGIIIIEEFYQ